MSCITAKVTRASEPCDVKVDKTEGIGVVVMAAVSAITAAVTFADSVIVRVIHHPSQTRVTVACTESRPTVNVGLVCTVAVADGLELWWTDTWYTVIIDPTNGTGSVNGSGKTFTALSASLTTGQNYFIFARKASDGGVQSRPCRFKSFKMWRNNVLLRDFIPVRIGQVGYMYDKVSNKFFGNVGTGSFTLGPDVS